MRPKQAIALMGPTASGKTEIAIYLAQELKGEIINLDSVQIYKEMDIGSAKPTPLEQKQAPHHLIDIVPPTQPMNSYEIYQLALKKGLELQEKGILPIFAGGTGLYFKALFYGMFEGAGREESIRQKIRAEKEEKGLLFLYEKLKQIDLETASSISPNDYLRIERGLEIYYLTGQKPSFLRKNYCYQPPFDFIKIGLSMEREKLYEKINQRVDKMISQGLLEEVKYLLEKYPNAPILRTAIGYKEIVDYLEKKIDYEQMLYLLKKHSRNFAKRQLTLFRALKEIQWFSPEEKEKIKEYVVGILK